MDDAEAKKIGIDFLMVEFFNSGQMQPYYADWIKDEEDANNNFEMLPLVYLWGERVIGNDLHYVVSINSAIVGKKLEQIMIRQDPLFVEVRDSFATMATELVKASIADTVAKLGLPPSKLFRLEK